MPGLTRRARDASDATRERIAVHGTLADIERKIAYLTTSIASLEVERAGLIVRAILARGTTGGYGRRA